MANRTWGRLLLTALGLSVLAGAGQLGIAYGFGIVRLTGEFTDGSVNRWPAQLVWVSWFAALAAVAGAILTERLVRRDEAPAETAEQLSVAGAAALGATVVAPLCMQPARAAEFLSVDPVWAVGICAVLGAVVGAGAALAVLLRPPLGWNVAVLAGLVWLLALVSAAPSLVGSGPLPTVRLGVLEPYGLAPDTAERLALVILPVVALISGAATGAVARRRGHPPLVSGVAGAAGPALIAFAYLSAGPGDSVDRYQLVPYYAALIALATGVLGSTAAALLRWPVLPAGRAGARSRQDAITPTDILRPLPAGTGLPDAPAAGAPPAAEPGGDRTGLVAAPGDARDGFRTTAGRAHADLFESARPAGSTPPHWDWPAPSASPATAPVGDAVASSATGVTSAAARSDRPATDVPATGAELPPAPGADRSPVAGGIDLARATGPDRPPADGPESPADTAPAEPSAARPAGAPTASGSGTPADGMAGAVAATAAGKLAAAGKAAAAGTPRRPRRTRRTADSAATTAPAAGPAATTGTESTTAGRTEAPGPAPTAKRARRRTAAAAATGAEATGEKSPAGADPVAPARPASAAAAGAPAATPDEPDATAGTPAGATPAPRPKRARASRAGAAATEVPPTGSGPAVADAPDPAPLDPARPGSAASGDPPGPAPANPDAATREPAAATPAGQPAAATPAAQPTAATPATKPAAATPAAQPAAATPAAQPAAAPAGGDRPATPDDRPAPAESPFPPGPPDEERRGPVPAWPVAPGRPAPLGRAPLAGPAGPGTAQPEEHDRAGRPDGVEPNAPRPRHRAPLPDLDRAASWDAFGNGFRRTAPPEPEPASGPPPAPAAAEEPAVPQQPDGDREAAAPAPEKARPKRGLFRRNRSRAEEPDRPPAEEPLPPRDEEYVDWVTGLAKEASEPAAEEPGRRSLRSTGRHHRD
ncbi:hypothetical protein AB0H57_07990 [Micromonospora sp. NPDC050686]|uniref:hypothetical protein n=1 Tax=Micromonospora sp. NPDC050686 TaxID=3154631 RepID=UPI00340964E5